MQSKTWTAKGSDSLQLWSATALVIKIAAMIAVVWIIYSQDLMVTFSQSNTASYVIIVPFFLVYLVYRNRKMLRATITFERSLPQTKFVHTDEVVGAALCLFAFLLFWQGSFTPYSLQYHIATLPLFVSGLILIVFNAQTLKTLALPLIFLLGLAPIPLEIVHATGAALAAYTSNAVYTILRALGLNMALTSQSGLPVLMLEKSSALPQILVMDIVFVGVYPLIVFTVLWMFVAFTVRVPAWKRGVMFLAWFPCILAFNALRVTIMTLIAYYFGIDVASEGLYTIVGWFFTLTGTFLLLFFASRKLLKIHIFAKESRKTSCLNCDQSREKKQNFCISCGTLLKNIDIKISKRDLIKIASIIMIVSLSTFIEVPAFALKDDKIQLINYLPKEGKVDVPILPEISGFVLSFGFPDKEFEKTVYPNASFTFVYTPRDEMKPTIYGALEFANPKDPLELRGEILDSRDAQVLQNPPITGTLVTLQRRDSNLTLVALYWYERAVFDAEPAIVRRYERASLFAFSNSSTDNSSVEENLIPIGQAIAGYWEPAREWSYFYSMFPEYLYGLSVMLFGLLAVIFAVYILNSEKEKRFNLKTFNKLALEDDKNVLRAVHQTEKTGKGSGNLIAASFQSLAGRPIDQIKLSETLLHAEELGLIKSRIVNENGEPLLVWKTQISFPSSEHRLQRIRSFLRMHFFVRAFETFRKRLRREIL